jgi:hypothetical protein
MDVRDWFILFHLNAAGVAATVFLFKHPEPMNFATYAGLLGTLVGCYHFFILKDSKTADAACQPS